MGARAAFALCAAARGGAPARAPECLTPRTPCSARHSTGRAPMRQPRQRRPMLGPGLLRGWQRALRPPHPYGPLRPGGMPRAQSRVGCAPPRRLTRHTRRRTHPRQGPASTAAATRQARGRPPPSPAPACAACARRQRPPPAAVGRGLGRSHRQRCRRGTRQWRACAEACRLQSRLRRRCWPSRTAAAAAAATGRRPQRMLSGGGWAQS